METNRRRLKGPAREEQTRAEIIAAAKRLVVKHGLHKVTMEDIASALGKKKSFLYYYYPGRTEVLHAVIEAEFTAMRQKVRDAVAAQSEVAEQVRAFVTARIDVIIAQAATYGSSTISSALQGAEPGTDFASLMELRQAFDRDEQRYVVGLLRQGIKDGAFRPLSGKVIEDTVYFLLSAMRGVELELLLSRDPISPSPRMGRVIDIFLRGLAM